MRVRMRMVYPSVFEVGFHMLSPRWSLILLHSSQLGATTTAQSHGTRHCPHLPALWSLTLQGPMSLHFAFLPALSLSLSFSQTLGSPHALEPG